MKKILYLPVITILIVFYSTQLYAWPTPVIATPGFGNQTYTGVTLDWLAVAGSEQYQVQLDTSPNFNSSVLISATKNYIDPNSNNSDTEHTIENLFFGQTYYWRVRAYVTGDTSLWAEQTFITGNTIVLNAPSSGSTNWAGLTLNWMSHHGVDFYDLEADTTPAFNSPALQSHSSIYIDTSSTNPDTEFFIDDIYFGTTYHWRVRARNAADTSGWSLVRNFTTRDFVAFISPTTGSLTWAGVTADWLSHHGVDFYDVQVDTTGLFNSPALQSATKTYIGTNSGNVDTQHFFDNLYFGATYYCRVRARNAVDTSSWGVVINFNVRDEVNLVSPLSGSSSWTGLTLDWDAHAGVDFYQLEADTTPAFNSPALRSETKSYINANNFNPDTRHFFNHLYFGKTYYWRVRVLHVADTSSWSTPWTFHTNDFVPLLTPADGLLNVNVAGVTLDWDSHTGVNLYQLQFDSVYDYTSPFLVDINKNYIDTSGNNPDTEHLTGLLEPNTVYFWRVRAMNDVDTSLWSNRYFSTADCEQPGIMNGAPVLCEGDTATYTIDPIVTALAYNWTLPPGWTGTSATNSITVTAGSGSGSILVTIENQCGISAPSVINITVDPILGTPGPLSGPALVCINSSHTFTIPPMQGAVSYVWNLPAGWTGSSTTNTIDITVDDNDGTISVYAVNSCDTSVTETYSINLSTVPNQPTWINISSPVCQGSVNSYLVTTVPGVTIFDWNFPLGWSGSSTTNSINLTAGSASGVVSVSAVNGCGPSLPASTNVTVITVDTTVQAAGITLNSNATSAVYQWLDCDNNFNPIPGETSQSFTATANGSYAVAVTQNGCTDTSACYDITTVGLSHANDFPFDLYPNPSNGSVIIDLGAECNNALFILNDVNGKRIRESMLSGYGKHTVHMNVSSGIYIATIISEKFTARIRLIIQ